jgi:YidC/Oxa1 family membrane protein insertase
MRERFKDDTKKQQQEMMKIYSEYGINPAGGCLPLILQLPILYALWAVLRTAIDLRQAHFFLWINDLSMPDVIFSLPFRLPLLNVDQFSGLALLMGITMFLQQKLTITDPRQKAMVYMMPVMFTLMFSSFPSGLNLYYFMFNLLSIVQQVYINKFSSSSKLTPDDLKKKPKKEGWFQKKMKEAQEIAASQGRSVPGASYDNTSKSKYQRKKKK